MRVSITIPVYNEESCLADTLNRLHAFLSSRDFGWDWEIVIADNGSTDRTREIAEKFAQGVRFGKCATHEDVKHAEAWTANSCLPDNENPAVKAARVRCPPFR